MTTGRINQVTVVTGSGLGVGACTHALTPTHRHNASIERDSGWKPWQPQTHEK